MKYIPLIGRILFSFIFLMTITSHFSNPSIQHATTSGVPLASILVPLSGVIAFLGSLSIIIGYKAKIGTWLIVLFLLPVTFIMHKFWGIDNQETMHLQMAMFMKNISILGGALIIAYFGTGTLSIDNVSHNKSNK